GIISMTKVSRASNTADSDTRRKVQSTRRGRCSAMVVMKCFESRPMPKTKTPPASQKNRKVLFVRRRLRMKLNIVYDARTEITRAMSSKKRDHQSIGQIDMDITRQAAENESSGG